MSHHFTETSILSFTPTTCGVVHFFDDADFAADGADLHWALPMVGWATVVTWASYEEVAGDTGQWEMEHETRLQPVVLDEGQPEAVDAYLLSRGPNCRLEWRVDPAAPWPSLATELPVT